MLVTVRYFLVALVLALLAAGRPVVKKNVWLVGDSTMCVYGPERAPLAGWGMPFAGFFDSSVTIHNHARGGRSTRTFISEERWLHVADSIKQGDYVLIQFGHNDEAKEEKYKERYTSVPDYKANLTRFINETRIKKGIPVLVTPVSRMRFDNAGNAQETHAEYSAAMKEVAMLQQVSLIDLDSASRALLQQLGPETSRFLFMQLQPGEHPNYPEGQKDNTHFNDYGARRMAELVLKGIRDKEPGLAERIVVGKLKK